MGCGVACVAYILKTGYNHAKKVFVHPEYACSRGYYCKEICEALKSKKKEYGYSRYGSKKKALLNIDGTIVFIGNSKQYPAGHFLVKAEKGWMNPWINFPLIIPAKSGFQKNLPGKAQWILYQKS